MSVPRGGRDAGFTLIEALLALALLAVVMVKVTMILGSAGDATSSQSAAMTLEDQARRVLDKIAYQVMSADRDQLFPADESPDFSTDVNYRMSLGVDADGEVIWSDWERISNENGQVVWRQNPDQADERRVAWCNVVRPFFEGELPLLNGLDDNGNGLADEVGLTFTLDRNAVIIRMSLERPKKDGEAYVESVETIVTCRN